MSQVPDMKIEFYLDQAQFVTFDYQILSTTAGAAWMLTTLMLDGVERKKFRVQTGHVIDHSNTRRLPVYVSKGKHTAYVNYRSNKCLHYNPNLDF